MHSKGIKDAILGNGLPYCITNKYSEASSRSLHLAFGLESKKANVAMAILEAAMLVDVGIPFCIACYQLEGDAPLILSSYLVFNKLEAKLNAEEGYAEVRKVLRSVIDLLNDAEVPHLSNKNAAKLIFETAKASLDSSKGEVNTLIERKKTLLSNGTSRSDRARASTNRMIDTEAIQEINLEILLAKHSLKQFKNELEKAKKELDSSQKDYDLWNGKFPHRTEQELMLYANSVSNPVKDYYTRLFIEEKGDNFRMRMCSFACKIFDPLFLKGKENDLHTLFHCCDLLVHFDYPAFTPGFILTLKAEVSHAVCLANVDFDWDSIPESGNFRTRMQKRMKRHSLLASVAGD